MAPDDEDFASLLAEYDEKRKDPKLGDEVKGRVVSIGRDAVFLDVGGKSDAMIDAAELRDPDGKLTVKMGDELEGRVVEVGGKSGCVVLRRAMGRGGSGAGAQAELEQAQQLGIPVEGLVTAVNKGGVEVQVAGTRGFCPLSQLDARPVDDPQVFVGQRLQFKITRYEIDRRGANLVLSRRTLMEAEAAQAAEKTREKLKVGAVLRGKVSSLKDYGAFVDLGGIDGMLHVSEMGHSRISHPKDLLAVGQEIDVQILKLDGDKISLSLKSLERDPWSEVAARFPEGAKVPGVISRVEPYGAFVEVAAGIEGLVHISELGSKKRLRHAKEAVKVGQSVTATVLSVDPHQRRISLSLSTEGEDSGTAADSPAAPSSLGTFADLLKKK